jgi:DNA-binding IclR family transcriptional regulator
MSVSPSKLKVARRCIRVLEFFDAHPQAATNQQIARSCGFAQSSISDLLAVMVDIGLLRQDRRRYVPTVRAAMLGSVYQPAPVRDGRLAMLIDQLNAQTGLGVAVVGMAGQNAQIYHWAHARRELPGVDAGRLAGGRQTPLWASPAGLVLLSTLGPAQWRRVIHRLRAEAGPETTGRRADVEASVLAAERGGHAAGPDGFGAGAYMYAVLLPGSEPLALCLVCEPRARVDSAELVALLRRAGATYAPPAENGGAAAAPAEPPRRCSRG